MKAKKSLGQNFLTSHDVARDSVESAYIQKGEWVLEIGPGKGFLTRELLQKEARVIALELDQRMIEVLHDTFPDEIAKDQLIILNKDVLEFRPDFLKHYIKDQSYKLVANIPYYITGAILRHFLQSNLQPAVMALLVQKEVADRIVARDNKESILSVSVKAYGNPKIVRRVSRKLFYPSPNVDSAVLLIENISKDFFSDIDEQIFFQTVKQGFSQKRKQIGNTLSLPNIFFENLNIDPTTRAEDLSLQQWKKIVHAQ